MQSNREKKENEWLDKNHYWEWKKKKMMSWKIVNEDCSTEDWRYEQNENKFRYLTVKSEKIHTANCSSTQHHGPVKYVSTQNVKWQKATTQVLFDV